MSIISPEGSPNRGHFSNAVQGVLLRDPQNQLRPVYTALVGGTSGNQYYELSNGTLILKSGNFPAAGEYVLHLVAQGYANKTLSIPIMEAESEGNGHGGGSEGTGSGESGGSGNAGEPGGGSGALSAVPGVAEVNYQRTGRMPYVRFVELVFDNSVSAEDASFKQNKKMEG